MKVGKSVGRGKRGIRSTSDFLAVPVSVPPPVSRCDNIAHQRPRSESRVYVNANWIEVLGCLSFYLL
jgi:hypothetical protein